MPPRPRITTLPGRPGQKPKLSTLPNKKSQTPKVTPLGSGGGLASKIDSYLEGRGSPMAGLGQKFVSAGQLYGVDPRLLVGIGVIESGAGKFERHPNNFANWGVHRGVTYETREEAIAALAKGMRDGYISQGLRTPRQIVSKYAPASDNNDEGNWASVVSGVMGKIGGSVPRDLTGRGGKGFAPGPTLGTPRTPEMRFGQTTPDSKSFLREGLLQSLMSGERLSGGGFLNLIRESHTQAEEAARAVPLPSRTRPGPGGGFLPSHTTDADGHVKYDLTSPKGGFLQAPTGWKGTHITDGLDMNDGQQTAVDIMAHPGTKVGAPESGTVVRHGSAQGGSSLYFESDSGHTYWMGHIEGMVPVGTKVKKGQPIAVISSDHAAPHLHIDKR